MSIPVTVTIWIHADFEKDAQQWLVNVMENLDEVDMYEVHEDE